MREDEAVKCCGLTITMVNRKDSRQLGDNAIVSAKEAGAEAMVTHCPRCHLNLDAYQPDMESREGRKLNMPNLDIPQLVAMALGVSKEAVRLQTHIVRPTGLLAS